MSRPHVNAEEMLAQVASCVDCGCLVHFRPGQAAKTDFLARFHPMLTDVIGVGVVLRQGFGIGDGKPVAHRCPPIAEPCEPGCLPC